MAASSLLRCAALATSSISTPALYRGASAVGRRYDNARLTPVPGRDGELELQLDFSEVELDGFKSSAHRRLYRVRAREGACEPACAHDVPLDPSIRVAVASPDGRRLLRVRKGGDGAGAAGAPPAADTLEIWEGGACVRRAKLAGKAGAVYADGVFGEPCFSADGTRVALLAEHPVPASFKSFFAKPDEPAAATAKAAKAAKEGAAEDKFRPRRDFGERLVGKVRPALIVLDVESGALCALSAAELGLPDAGVHPAHVRFDAGGDGVLFCAYDVRGFKQGLSACLNRPTALWHARGLGACLEAARADAAGSPAAASADADADGGAEGAGAAAPALESRLLTPGSFLALGPKPSADGRALYCVHHPERFEMHSTCFELAALSLPVPGRPGAPRAVLPLVRARPADARAFAGLYGFHDDMLKFEVMRAQPAAGSAAGGAPPPAAAGSAADVTDVTDVLCVQTIVGAEAAVFIARATPRAGEECTPTRLWPAGVERRGSVSLLAAHSSGVAVVRHSALDVPPSVHVVTGLGCADSSEHRWALVSNGEQEARAATRLDPEASAAVGAICDALRAARVSTVRLPSTGAEATLLLPGAAAAEGPQGEAEGGEGPSSARAPLVVHLHGGPHSAALDAYEPKIAMLLARGVAALLPNYRGSLGFGAEFVEALPGRVGRADVDDCAELTAAALREHARALEPSAVGAFGGSHGGFLGAWLAGHARHRALFSCVSLWNPVTNLVSMLGGTEIPEWCLCEGLGRKWAGGGAGGAWPLSGEDVAALHAASPMSVIGSVQCEAQLVLGGSDKRVPPTQGREWCAALEARGHAVQLHEYPDDGHSLAGPEATAHVSVSIVRWLAEQLAGGSGAA